ncbi:MAG: M56 family metallopeptidase [Pedobacter sp.]|uniref:M56 family metallopeptidase n=1 Tax=Pedobacter sp. TaxID=1411316 RepID=UPI002807338C|nr:M56 family metallopeptidase [Pedobacter sp.]MDQ8003631.1 M56 family metallopeptidase [Pedobacter sp.]
MELFYYLLKVSACLVLFFAFYLLVLNKLTFFKFNRLYLLATLLLSFVIPTLQFTIEREVEQVQIVAEEVVEIPANEIQPMETIPNFVESTTVEGTSVDWLALIPYAYILVTLVILSLGIRKILKLLQHTKQKTITINGLKLISKADGFTNCSFFNYVFIDEKSLSENELEVLLQHESVHAQQFHSIDKIVMMLAKATVWFNPVVYLWDKALEQVHEYEADEATSNNFGSKEYASLLLKLAVDQSRSLLVHNFVKSPIKERIKMLFNSKSTNMKKLMYLLVAPIALGLIWGFTVEVIEVEAKDKKTNELIRLTEKTGKELWGTTIKGKVKTILLTGVGEVLNFQYDKGLIRVFNPAVGKIKIGDELAMKVAGTVQQIMVSDAKGDILKELDAPCITVSLIKSANGALLYKLKNQQKPFISKTSLLKGNDYREERITLNTYSGKILSAKMVFVGQNHKPAKIYTYVNGKLFNEQESLKFDKNFISKLSTDRGFSFANDFDFPEIKDKNEAVVFWFGQEPKLSFAKTRSRQAAKTYNGQVIGGKVVDVTYNESKLMNGFIVKTSKETVKANVEAKFATQIHNMIKIGDDVSIKVYNADYWRQMDMPILISYKLMKNGKLLFDRWPKIAKHNELPVKKNNEYLDMDNGLNNFSYYAKDSTIVDKKNKTINLYGAAKFSTKEFIYEGSKITYNEKLKKIKVYDANLIEKSTNKVRKADSIFVDLNQSKGIVFGVIKDLN